MKIDKLQIGVKKKAKDICTFLQSVGYVEENNAEEKKDKNF